MEKRGWRAGKLFRGGHAREKRGFSSGRAHVCMTTTTYDDDDDDDDDVDGDNGKKLEESKPTVGGVDRGAFPRATSRKVARRAFQGGETRVRQRDVARVTKREGCERARRGEGWKTGRIWWPGGWPRGEEGRESPGQDFSTPPRRSRTRTRFSCVRSFFEREREREKERNAFLFFFKG